MSSPPMRLISPAIAAFSPFSSLFLAICEICNAPRDFCLNKSFQCPSSDYSNKYYRLSSSSSGSSSSSSSSMNSSSFSPEFSIREMYSSISCLSTSNSERSRSPRSTRPGVQERLLFLLISAALTSIENSGVRKKLAEGVAEGSLLTGACFSKKVYFFQQNEQAAVGS